MIYTAIQQALSKAANHPIRLTYDSSSPHRASGMARAIYLKPELTSSLRSWRMPSEKIPQNLRVARGHATVDLPEFSPLSRIFNVNHLVIHTQKNRLGRVDSLSEQLMTNHNIYTFHATALDACDLVFGDRPDFSKVPMVLQDFVKFVADFFQSDRSGELLLKNESVLKTLDPDPKPKKKT